MKQQTLGVAADENAGFEQYRRLTKRDVFLAKNGTRAFEVTALANLFLARRRLVA
jgi:hypothetical protein